jgi:hypothetical protein
MKKSGILIIALSLLILYLAFNMDVVVGTTYNIGLLNERQNIVYLSGVLFLSGIMLLGFGFVAKEDAENIEDFALWTFFTPIVLLIAIKLVAYSQEAVQEANQENEIQMQAEEQANRDVEQTNTYAKYAEQATREIEATAKRLKDNSEKFIDNKDGTVTLKANGWIWQRSNDLMWQRCSIGQNWTGTTCEGDAKKFTWDDAIKLTSNFAGYNDWRLPTNKELRSLIYCSDGMTQTLGKEESGRLCTASPLSPTINTIYFPNTPSDWFWSSTPRANSSSSAWRVYFYNGYSDDNGKDSYGNVQLVR